MWEEGTQGCEQTAIGEKGDRMQNFTALLQTKARITAAGKKAPAIWTSEALPTPGKVL